MEDKTEEYNIDHPKYYIALQLVFSHLKFEDRIKCELVCKKWKTISRNINAKQQKHLSNELYPMYKFSGCFVTCKYI